MTRAKVRSELGGPRQSIAYPLNRYRAWNDIFALSLQPFGRAPFGRVSDGRKAKTRHLEMDNPGMRGGNERNADVAQQQHVFIIAERQFRYHLQLGVVA